LAHPQTTLDALRKRYESLATMTPDLPSALSMPPSLNTHALSKRIAPLLLSKASAPDGAAEETTPPKSVDEDALALALLGWQAEAGHVSGLAICEACFRRLGLWLFKTKSNTTDPGGDDEEASMSRLDVVAEHREYCPWINAASQSGGVTPRKGASSMPELAGWEILLRVIETAQHSRSDTNTLSVATPVTESDAAGDDVASEVMTIASTASGLEDRAARDAKDKERWAKLKKLKQVFHVKRKSQVGVGKGDLAASRPGTAG